jgi:hypothetical protein
MVGGGGVAGDTGSAPSEAVAQALRVIGLGGKFGDIAQRALASAPATRGSTGGVSLSDVVRSGAPETIGATGGPVAGPEGVEGAVSTGAPSGVDSGGVSVGGPSLGGAILGAGVNILRGIPTYEQIANSTYSDVEKAILIGQLLGAKGSEGFFSPFLFGAPLGLSEGALSFFRNIFGDPPLTHKQREQIGEGGVISGFNQLSSDIQEAGTPEELWQAFAPTTTENFRTGRASGYPIFASGEDLNQASLMKAIQSGDPTALTFAYQAGIEPGVLEQVNAALNATVQNQVSLIRTAEQGDPTARGILAQKAEARATRRREAEEANRRAELERQAEWLAFAGNR